MQNSTKEKLFVIIGYLSLFLVPIITTVIIGTTTKNKNYVVSSLGLFSVFYFIIFLFRVLRRQKENFSYTKLTEEEVKKAIEEGKYTPGIRFSQIMFSIAAIIFLIASVVCNYVL